MNFTSDPSCPFLWGLDVLLVEVQTGLSWAALERGEAPLKHFDIHLL